MLELKHITKRFRGVHALSDVSLRLDRGVVLGIVGDNGAGKSTLMKCISAALHPDEGTILFDGIDLSGATPATVRLRGIEMIYQDLGLCTLQDAISNVFLGQERRKGLFLDRPSMEKACAEAFLELGAVIPLRTPVGSLSGGQRQAIAIARAMLSNPKILIMDEPTAALAAGESRKVLEHVLSVKEKGVSVIIISHNLAELLQVADRIVVMRQGKVTYDLTPKETNLKDLTEKIVSDA